jgi:hypothetical protein
VLSTAAREAEARGRQLQRLVGQRAAHPHSETRATRTLRRPH